MAKASKVGFASKFNINKNLLIKQSPLFLMLLPGIIAMVLFNYLPMTGIVVAFKDFSYIKGLYFSDWIGLKNFEVFFRTPDAWIITRNTILYNVVFIVFGTVLKVFLALLLNEIISKTLKKLYQTIILLPHFLSWVIIAYLLYGFLSSEYGILNNIIVSMGGAKISWYSEPKYWPFIITFVNMWHTVGYGSIVYSAAISGINTEYYEAATIDGAGRFKQIIHITIPSLKSVIIVMTILALGKMFNSDFGLFYQVPMNSGPLYPVTNTLSTYVYNIRNDVGMATAAGLYQSVVGFLLVITANKIVDKIDPENALY